MSTVKALILDPTTSEVTLRNIPKPTPATGEVLIRVRAIALNPVDGLFIAHPIATSDRVIGLDFAGVVEGAASDLETSTDKRTQTGARVAGFLQGACSGNFRPGAFAEYITAPYDLIWSVPDDMPLENASAVSMCGLTAAQGVFYRMGLPAPFADTASATSSQQAEPINVLVYGSSSSLGQYAAQMVNMAEKTSGRKIRLIGAASRAKHAFLSAAPFNYDVLVDYRDADWPEQVRKATEGAGVQYAVDSIAEGNTPALVESTLSEDGKFVTFVPHSPDDYDASKLRIQPVYGAVWEGLGEMVTFRPGMVFPADLKARAFAASFFDYLGSGGVKVVPNPIRLMPGGLENVVADGLALVSHAKVSQRKVQDRTEEYMRPISGEKIVYTIA